MHFRSSPRRKTRATKPSRSRQLEPQMKKRQTAYSVRRFFYCAKMCAQIKKARLNSPPRPGQVIESGLLAFARPRKLVRVSKGLIAL